MNNIASLNDTWLKASILGATWAASEIILGSFLHNLHVPFKGNILTTIAFVLLIAVSYKWKNRGLFWRAGLICALMKTMSPSAVIFGPMVAIFMEALLLDVSTRVLGRNFFGFIVGATLAMSWILIQKIFNLILFYGAGLVDIYAQLMEFVEQQLQIQFNMFWTPIAILLGFYFLFAIVAVILGMMAGQKLINKPKLPETKIQTEYYTQPGQDANQFPYSLSWLIINLAIFVGMFFLLNNSSFWFWVPATFIVIFIWSHRYRRAIRQLSKPKFWIFFVVITMVSAFIITAIQNNGHHWTRGLLAGLQMNFRAAIVITGFTVLGTELYNPRIRQFFAESALKQLPLALNLAFETLPYVIGKLPDVKSILRQPVRVIRILITHAEDRLSELKSRKNKPVILITGDKRNGKTQTAKKLRKLLQSRGIAIGGVLSDRITNNGETTGYDLINISTGKRMPFLKKSEASLNNRIGRFEIDTATLRKGKQILNSSNLLMHDVVVIDEVGKLELKGKGWAQAIEEIMEINILPVIITVRTDFADDVVEKFGINNPFIFNVSNSNSLQIAKKIIDLCLEKEKITV